MTSKSDPPEVFAGYSDKVREKLLAVRGLIQDCARTTHGVGSLVETRKWGQPAYLTERPKSGTTIRIDGIKDRPGHYAMYFHCGTTLVDTVRQLYPDTFEFSGNRALILSTDAPVPEAELRHCIQLALTYHL